MDHVREDQHRQFYKAANDLFDALKSAVARKGTCNAFDAPDHVKVVDLAQKVVDVDDRRQKRQALAIIDEASACVTKHNLDGQFQRTVKAFEKIASNNPGPSEDAEIVRLARKMIAINKSKIDKP